MKKTGKPLTIQKKKTTKKKDHKLKTIEKKNSMPRKHSSNKIGRKNKSIEGNDKFLCPECGSQSLIKIERKPSNTYIFKCKYCGATSHPLPIKTNYTICT